MKKFLTKLSMPGTLFNTQYFCVAIEPLHTSYAATLPGELTCNLSVASIPLNMSCQGEIPSTKVPSKARERQELRDEMTLP